LVVASPAATPENANVMFIPKYCVIVKSNPVEAISLM
jgi:hypothetical protein